MQKGSVPEYICVAHGACRTGSVGFGSGGKTGSCLLGVQCAGTTAFLPWPASKESFSGDAFLIFCDLRFLFRALYQILLKRPLVCRTSLGIIPSSLNGGIVSTVLAKTLGLNSI